MDKLILVDGMPIESMDGILMELEKINAKLSLLNQKLETGLNVLEGAYMSHLEECHQ